MQGLQLEKGDPLNESFYTPKWETGVPKDDPKKDEKILKGVNIASKDIVLFFKKEVDRLMKRGVPLNSEGAIETNLLFAVALENVVKNEMFAGSDLAVNYKKYKNL